MANDALTKLIAENKERPIAEHTDGGEVLISGGVCQSICSGSDEWVTCHGVYLAGKGSGDDYYTVNDYFYVMPTHFRPLPDDRLARVTEVLLEGMNKVLNRAMVHDHEGYEEIAKATIQRATAIAEGKE